MKKLEDVGVLVARILMPILFITAGWGKITGYAGTQQYMEAMGVPGFMLPLPDPHHRAVHRRLHRADRVSVPQQLC